eukprot:1150350-Pelagomonas_calceolata.AAC.3
MYISMQGNPGAKAPAAACHSISSASCMCVCVLRHLVQRGTWWVEALCIRSTKIRRKAGRRHRVDTRVIETGKNISKSLGFNH